MSFIFILGQHRTGSTLLKNMLNAHSNISMLFDEMNLYDPFRSNTLDALFRSEELTVKKLIHAIRTRRIYGTFWEAFEKSSISLEQLEFRLRELSVLNEQGVIETILNIHKENSQCSFSGVKYPVHFSKTNTLVQWFPNAKILFITRHPKAIIASKLNDPATLERKGKSLFHRFVVHYLTLVHFSMEYRKSVETYCNYPSKLFLVRYESLILNKEKTLKDICTFIGVPFEKEMLSAEGKLSSYTGTLKLPTQLPITDRYKVYLSKLDQLIIDSITRRSFKKLNS